MIHAAVTFIFKLYSMLTAAFVVTFIALGLAFTVLFPPFQVADEDLHWLNAYDKVERFFAALSGTAPVKCNAGIGIAMHFDANPLKSNLTVKAAQDRFATLSNVPPTCYAHVEIPSSSVVSYPGVLLARAVVREENLKPERALLTHYLSRFFQGLLIALAFIRGLVLFRRGGLRLPAGVLTVAAYALSPMFINQAFGVTYDSVTLLLMAAGTNLLFFQRHAATADYLLFSFAALAAASSKPPFLPFAAAVAAFIALLQLSEWFRTRRGGHTAPRPMPPSRLAWLGHYLPMALALSAALLLIARTSQVSFTVPAGIDTVYNRNFLLDDLGRAFRILWDSPMTLVKLDLMASVLGWTNVQISTEGILMWKRLVYFALGFDILLIVISLARRLASGALGSLAYATGAAAIAALPVLISVTALIILSALSMYILWTPKDTIGVVGLQIRYFITVFPITFAVIPALSNYISDRGEHSEPPVAGNLSGVLAAVSALLLIAALLVPYAARMAMEVTARFY